jgi:hypothetical protein
MRFFYFLSVICFILLIYPRISFAASPINRTSDKDHKKDKVEYTIIKGKVEDSISGAGIAGAKVTATTKRGKAYAGTTDSNGDYEINLSNKRRRAAKLNVVASANAYKDSQPQVIKVIPRHTYILNFALERTDTTPPEIIITSPQDGFLTNQNSITINYTVDGEAESENRTLTEGPNTLTINATDAAGNSSSKSISGTLDTTAPQLTVASPLDNDVIRVK